jgi:GxxExxY protein
MDVERVAAVTIDCGFQIHSTLGPGLLESAYEAVLAHALERRGLKVERQRMIPITFEGLVVEGGFRADLLVNRCLLIELKSIDRLAPVHGKQVLTYLRFLDLSLGLLMNFGGATFKEGLRRIVNNH